MSLFGGDVTPQSQSESEAAGLIERSESDRSASAGLFENAHSPSTLSRGERRQNTTHRAASVDDSLDPDEGEFIDDPLSKFTGPPSTWRWQTAAERQLSKSLDQIQASDLSIHLYNAHALKRKPYSRRSWGVQSPASKDQEIPDPRSPVWEIPAFWTAWPLKPQFVQRPYESFGTSLDDRTDDGSFKRKEHSFPSSELEDILLGILQNRAKKMWEQRKEDDEGSPIEVDSSASLTVEARRARTRSNSIRSRASSRLESGQNSGNVPQPGSPSTHSRSAGTDSNSVGGSEYPVSSPTSSTDECLMTGSKCKEPGSPSRKFKYSKPVVMAAEEKARRLLQPTVRSLIASLDALLVGLHRSRSHQVGTRSRSAPELIVDKPKRKLGTSSTTKSQPEAKRHKVAQRGRPGRPPRHISDPETPNLVEDLEEGQLSKTKKVGRPKVYRDRLPGETYYMMHKRLASQTRVGGDKNGRKGISYDGESSHSLSSSDEDVDQSLSRSPSRKPTAQEQQSHASSPEGRGTSTDSIGETPKLTGLRDWSEVLGIASMISWDQDVIQRTARRCTTLFKESMTFQTLEEDEAFRSLDAPVIYYPKVVTQADAPRMDEDAPKDAHNEIPYWSRDMLSCPHGGCWGSEKEFPTSYRVVEHIMRVHKYDPRVTKYDTEDITGTTASGFLRTLARKQGQRGKDKAKRNRSGRRKNESDGDS